MAPLFGCARYICEKGDWAVSNLKLQKVLYMAHMVHMGRTRERLIEPSFEAWDYGPVVPQLYHKVKAFGSKPIPDVFSNAGNLSADVRAILSEACDHLIDKTPGQLVEITHRPWGAWAKNYVPGIMGIEIPDRDVLNEYQHRVGRKAA